MPLDFHFLRQKMTKPVKKYAFGDTGISLWKVKIRGHDSVGSHNMVDGYRACIEHSVWDRMSGKWRRQHILVDGRELGYLSTILEPMTELYRRIVSRW